MSKSLVFSLIIVFALGWLSHTAYSLYINPAIENIDNGLDVQQLLGQSAKEKNKDSPGDWISMDQIKVYNNRVILDIQNPEWAIFTDTKSMDPVIDSTSNAIEVIPKRPEDIRVGDIVAYKSKYATGIITHRVVEIGSDEKGWYARMKGDNNPRKDPGKIRFDQVKRVVVAIIY